MEATHNLAMSIHQYKLSSDRLRRGQKPTTQKDWDAFFDAFFDWHEAQPKLDLSTGKAIDDASNV